MLQVHDWDRWQTYRSDRGQPPWIKIHRQILRNLKWVALNDAEKGQLVAIWILAADSKGTLPNDPDLVQRLCYMSGKPNLTKYIDDGFLEPYVTPKRRRKNAKCPQNVTPEAEAETKAKAKAKAETDTKNHGDATLPNWLDKKAWSEFVQHRKEIKKPMTKLSVTKCLNVLENHKDVQAAIIDKSINNRWTGLFPPKLGGHARGTFDDHQAHLERQAGQSTTTGIESDG